MGIYIKSIKKPWRCDECMFTNSADECLFLHTDADIDGLNIDCPIREEAPSIDIVRCKECKYRKNRADYEKEYCLQHSKVLYDTGGGCSWGKGANDE